MAEFNRRKMSVAGLHATKFYEQVTSSQKVFGLEDEGSFLVFRVDGHDVVPFWSSRSRLLTIQKRSAKYQKWRISEHTLSSFTGSTLPFLESEKIHIGLNWSGARLVGYDVSVSDLQRTLKYWMERRAKQPREAGP